MRPILTIEAVQDIPGLFNASLSGSEGETFSELTMGQVISVARTFGADIRMVGEASDEGKAKDD